MEHGKMKQSEVEKEQYLMQKRLSETMGIVENFKFVAVGYLDITEEYTKGVVSQNFLNKLRIVFDEGGCTMTLGFHECEFCIDEGNYENRVTSSSEKVIVDRENNIKYIFPEMIFHYIKKHNYQPPKEFVEFILKK